MLLLLSEGVVSTTRRHGLEKEGKKGKLVPILGWEGNAHSEKREGESKSTFKGKRTYF